MTRVVLESGPKGLVRVLADARVPADDNIMLLVDQFEELFRFAGSNESASSASTLSRNESLQFVALLLETARQAERPMHVVLTMRTDFIGDCDQFDGLPQAINAGQFLVPRLSWQQQERAITAPLQLPGFESQIDRSIIDHMLNTASRERDSLPLVQHVLLRMWLAAAGPDAISPSDGESAPAARHITETEHYLPIGGLAHALDRHATELYESLPPEQQRIAECLFRCLGERSPKGQLTRRLTNVQEVASVADVAPEEVIGVVEVFRQPGVHFLVSSPAGAMSAASSIDISHESLLRQWTLLQTWISAEEKSVETYRQIVYHARRWKNGQGMLWRPPLLTDALDWRNRQKPTPAWARRHGGDFAISIEFLDACVNRMKQERESQVALRRRETIWDRFAGRFFGNDFFISYAWSDSRQYATALAKALELRGYKCFIDEENYATGDKWMAASKLAIRRALRMVLLASPAAAESQAVIRDVRTFASTGRAVLPVSFGGSLEQGSTLANAIGPYALRIDAPLPDLGVGPSDEVLEKISASFVMSRVTTRQQRFVLSIAAVLVVLLLLSTVTAGLAMFAKSEAESAYDTTVIALNKQLELYTSATSQCGIIAWQVGKLTVEEDRESLRKELSVLAAGDRPVVVNAEIQDRLSDLEEAINDWTPTDSWSSANVRNRALQVARAYRHTWDDQTGQLPGEAQALLAASIAKPIYERAIRVVRRLAANPAPADVDEFEKLYWGDLILFETPAAEKAMVSFRRQMQENSDQLRHEADGLELALKEAISMLSANHEGN